MAGQGIVEVCVVRYDFATKVDQSGVATQKDVFEVGKRRGGLYGYNPIADNTFRLEQGKTVVATNSTDTNTIKTIIAMRIPKSVGKAVDIRTIKDRTVTNGESGLYLTLVLMTESTGKIEERTEILVAEGASIAAEKECVVPVIVAVEGGILIKHRVDDNPVFVGFAVGDEEVVVADILRVEP